MNLLLSGMGAYLRYSGHEGMCWLNVVMSSVRASTVKNPSQGQVKGLGRVQ